MPITRQRTVKTIGRGTIVIADSTTSNTATITAVDTTKTELRFLGSEPEADSAANHAGLVLTNSTTITATRIPSPATETTVSYEYTEYY